MVLEFKLDNPEINIKEFLYKQGLSHRLFLSLKRNNSIKTQDGVLIVDLDYEESSDNIVSSNISIDIIHEDDSLLILNKPAGIPVHPSLHYYDTSLSNGVKNYFNQKRIKENDKTCK